MPELYWTKYDLLQFAAKHILENFDTSQIKTHNSFWPAGTTKEYLEKLLEWIIPNYEEKIKLPPNSICGEGFATYEFFLDSGIKFRLGVTSRGRISLFQPLDGENVIKVNQEEAHKLFAVLFSNTRKGERR